jgi:hypothetical protein
MNNITLNNDDRAWIPLSALVNVWHAPGHALPAAHLLGLMGNAVAFPIGCVAVLYFIARLNDRAAAAAAHA